MSIAASPVDRNASDETYMPPSRSPWAETWHLLRKNRMAFTGLVIFLVFFAVAVVGLAVTSGKDPILDPARVRLQEKLRPPLSSPKTDTMRAEELPALGLYILGTDDLGRDVFARMLQGAWVSLTVGFVAVGIAVGIGILLGGISGYYGRQYIQFGHILFWLLLVVVIVLAFHKIVSAAAVLLTAAIAGWIWKKFHDRSMSPLPVYLQWIALPTMQVDTLIMRAVDIMLCFPSFFLILTVRVYPAADIENNELHRNVGLKLFGTADFTHALVGNMKHFLDRLFMAKPDNVVIGSAPLGHKRVRFRVHQFQCGNETHDIVQFTHKGAVNDQIYPGAGTFYHGLYNAPVDTPVVGMDRNVFALRQAGITALGVDKGRNTEFPGHR